MGKERGKTRNENTVVILYIVDSIILTQPIDTHTLV